MHRITVIPDVGQKAWLQFSQSKCFSLELSTFGLFADSRFVKSGIPCKLFHSFYSGQLQVVVSGGRNGEKIDFECQHILFQKK